ncbi:MAG: hypothetical protein F6K54_01525 [Okeania sp. SIO3B5]|uniref:hypothetical protein n=1 Tax=Okeania sp. SIO3B5 TaxID=2607811 RepID=UPI001400B41C|nr:hypothetical protein [Okeania sp. SIO3B5]NEO51882.1 hypothetical protein [Okeania sp. SIO3B5]
MNQTFITARNLSITFLPITKGAIVEENLKTSEVTEAKIEKIKAKAAEDRHLMFQIFKDLAVNIADRHGTEVSERRVEQLYQAAEFARAAMITFAVYPSKTRLPEENS